MTAQTMNYDNSKARSAEISPGYIYNLRFSERSWALGKTLGSWKSQKCEGEC